MYPHVILLSVCLSVHHTRAPAKATGQNKMPFGSDNGLVPCHIVLDRGPGLPTGSGRFGVQNHDFGLTNFSPKTLYIRRTFICKLPLINRIILTILKTEAPKSCIVNRQTGVRHSKYVVVSDGDPISVFFVNEDDDENFRWRSYFNFRWRDENCDDNSDSFINVTKTAMKISVFLWTRWRRKLSERRKPFRHKFKICKRLSWPYSVSSE